MNIKMIAVDLDGTLFRDDKTVSDRTNGALIKCRDKGIKVVYATARGDSAGRLAPSDLFDGYVRMNGAVAWADDILIHSKCIPTVEARELLLAVDNAGMQIAAEVGGWHYTNFHVPEVWGPEFQNCYEIADFNTLNVMAEKMYTYPRSEAEVELIKKHLPKETYFIITREDNFTMIMHENASKSSAVAALAEHWNIESTEIVAFGDDIIDIDMLQHCGIGVAMGNAIDEVKAVADYVCDTNENDGIAKWIEENVL